jgi:integrase
MAGLETRRNSSGEVVSYRVIWRQDGARQSETFLDHKQALDFKRDVQLWGNTWPDGWIRRWGYQLDAIPESERIATKVPAAKAPALLSVALAHFADGPNRYTKSAPEHRLKMRRDLERHLAGDLGNTPIDEVTREQVQDWLDDQSERYVFKTVKGRRAAVGAVFRGWCREHGGINPVEGSYNDGAQSAFKPVFLKQGEVDAIIEQLPTLQDKVYVELLVGTGMRKGEALALQIWDLDLDRNEIDINKARKHSHRGGVHRIGDPKTDSSRRIIGIDDDLADMLRDFTAGRAGAETVFDLGNEGTWQNNHWAPARVRAGLRKNPRIHDLRHTHASILLSKGARLLAVSRRLGHKDIQTTANIYGHLDRTEDAGLAAMYGAARHPEQQQPRKLRVVQ